MYEVPHRGAKPACDRRGVCGLRETVHTAQIMETGKMYNTSEMLKWEVEE